MAFVDSWQTLSAPFKRRGFILNLSSSIPMPVFHHSLFSLNFSLRPFPMPFELLIQCQLYENSTFQIPLINPYKRTWRALKILSTKIGLNHNCFFMLHQPGNMISFLSKLWNNSRARYHRVKCTAKINVWKKVLHKAE